MSKNKIIWLDANSSDPESSFRSKLGDAQTFIQADDCVQYVQSHSNESIFLIVSGSLAEEAVPKIYECSNLVKIYLFCGSIAAYAEWGMNYCDKLMIFNHEDNVLERLWNDLHKILHGRAMLCFKRAEEYKERASQYKRQCG